MFCLLEAKYRNPLTTPGRGKILKTELKIPLDHWAGSQGKNVTGASQSGKTTFFLAYVKGLAMGPDIGSLEGNDVFWGGTFFKFDKSLFGIYSRKHPFSSR